MPCLVNVECVGIHSFVTQCIMYCRGGDGRGSMNWHVCCCNKHECKCKNKAQTCASALCLRESAVPYVFAVQIPVSAPGQLVPFPTKDSNQSQNRKS